MKISEIVADNKSAIAFTIAVMLVGTLAYFAYGAGVGMPASNPDAGIYDGIGFKVAIGPDGSMKLFARARNSAIAKLASAQGSSIPEDGSMVLGYAEAASMRKSRLFNKTGDVITNFFGVQKLAVGGILEKTGGPVDEMIFLDAKGFDAINGSLGRIYAKMTPAKMPKMFYNLGVNEALPGKLKLAQGSIRSYSMHDLGGVLYYPMIVGAGEAGIMRSENLFKNPGDSINGFFGRNMVIDGVLETTNTSADMMNFVPLGDRELGVK